MSAGGSTKVILISLCANMGIAVSKLFGALFTGSAALMAEAVHSFSDCGNQALLLWGQRAAKKGVSEKYPLGRSKEAFFWSFVVALLLFSMGGIFSVYEGLHKMQHPEPLSHPHVGIIILLIAVGLEGYSFWACLKEVRMQNTYGSLWQWIRKTTSADLLVIFLEDFAALLGLMFALTALTIAWISGNTTWDGLGSFCIGGLLIGVAVILAREAKSLLIGEAPAYNYKEQIHQMLVETMPEARLLRLLAVQIGVDAVLIAYKIHPGESHYDVATAIALTNTLEARVRERFPEIAWQFVEWDILD